MKILFLCLKLSDSGLINSASIQFLFLRIACRALFCKRFKVNV